MCEDEKDREIDFEQKGTKRDIERHRKGIDLNIQNTSRRTERYA